MNVLIINNRTKNLKHLEHLFKNHTVKTVKYRRHTLLDRTWADLIILSGSSKNPAIFTRFYQNEVNLINRTDKPIVGICLGFELIARSRGIKVKKLKTKVKGLVKIKVTPGSLDMDTDRMYTVYESHRWHIDYNKDMEIIAISNYGNEIIKLTDRNVYGIQFHPEILAPSNEGQLIFNKILYRIFNSAPA